MKRRLCHFASDQTAPTGNHRLNVLNEHPFSGLKTSSTVCRSASLALKPQSSICVHLLRGTAFGLRRLWILHPSGARHLPRLLSASFCTLPSRCWTLWSVVNPGYEAYSDDLGARGSFTVIFPPPVDTYLTHPFFTLFLPSTPPFFISFPSFSLLPGF